MIQSIRRMMLPALLCAVILPASSSHAAGEWRYYHPSQLVLTETTPLFNGKPLGMGGALAPVGASLAPQVVNCVGGFNREYYEIETWMGRKWVSADFRIYGQEPNAHRFKNQISETMYLYDEPFDDKKTTLSISPQIVESTDATDVGNRTFLKIKTWIGDKWLRMGEITTPVEAIQRWDEKTETWITISESVG
ncbi:hypothetical protein [Paenibacillus piri]|uniref:Uncharacterized protein n=1 Tax=Paenibacillus piri TaxID=2547395 RepID=A0A4R5K9C2_9BACL|nr:hypothetical protein [Paenibacillus piri]TDF88855.1 hypothetical protein E1757_35090 [Paenibacillus piri]